MLGLNELKQTKVYQEALIEGEQIGELKVKLIAVPDLIQLGLNLDVIAGVLKLPIEVVQQIAQSFYVQNIAFLILVMYNYSSSISMPKN